MTIPTHLIILATTFTLMIPIMVGVKLGIQWWTRRVEEEIQRQHQTIPEFIQPVPQNVPTDHIILDIRPPILTSIVTISSGQRDNDIAISTYSFKTTATDNNEPIPDTVSIGQAV